MKMKVLKQHIQQESYVIKFGFGGDGLDGDDGDDTFDEVSWAPCGSCSPSPTASSPGD